MNTPENLVKIGNAVLTQKAIAFIERLQDEKNESITNYSKCLSETVAAVHILLSQDGAAPDIIERLKENISEVAHLAFEIERLAKP